MPQHAHINSDRPVDEFKEQMLALIPSLRAFTRGLCHDVTLADDIAQDAMMRAWAARDSFTPGTNFRAWMFTIARNQFYTHRQVAGRFTTCDPEAAERILIQMPNQEMNMHLHDVDTALQKLPPQQREILLLIVGSGMTYEEAAIVADCTVGTVKSRLARGRVALLKLLAEGEVTFFPDRAKTPH